MMAGSRGRGWVLLLLVGGLWFGGLLMGGVGAFGSRGWLLAQGGVGWSWLGYWMQQRLMAAGFEAGWPFALGAGRLLMTAAGLLNWVILVDLVIHGAGETGNRKWQKGCQAQVTERRDG